MSRHLGSGSVLLPQQPQRRMFGSNIAAGVPPVEPRLVMPTPEVPVQHPASHIAIICDAILQGSCVLTVSSSGHGRRAMQLRGSCWRIWRRTGCGGRQGPAQMLPQLLHPPPASHRWDYCCTLAHANTRSCRQDLHPSMMPKAMHRVRTSMTGRRQCMGLLCSCRRHSRTHSSRHRRRRCPLRRMLWVLRSSRPGRVGLPRSAALRCRKGSIEWWLSCATNR